MGLLDQVIGAALGGNANSQGGGGGINALVVQQLIGLLSKPGALNNLLAAFQQKGMGNIAQSWVGTGENLPISAAQVQQALGAGTLAELARGSGMGVPETADALSSLLPRMVDGLSPRGQVPPANELDGLLASVGKLLN